MTPGKHSVFCLLPLPAPTRDRLLCLIVSYPDDLDDSIVGTESLLDQLETRPPGLPMRKTKTAGRLAAAKSVILLVATRKGAFILRGDPQRKNWTLSAPLLLGSVVHHFIQDPRDGRTILLAACSSLRGPTVFQSSNLGKTLKEASRPPAFARAPEGQKGRVVDHVFRLTAGHANEPESWYAGTSPQGLFCSEDGGSSWDEVLGFHDHPMFTAWTGGDQDAAGQAPKLHSILIDPRNPDHMYLGMSRGGVFESEDKGADWKPLNQGCASDFIPVPNPEYGHDPHRVLLHPLMPDRLYQQNHCGIYRMDRPEGRWIRIGSNMPGKIGDIGFPIVQHPRDPNTVWVFPMDGTSVRSRMSPGGRPAVYVTHNAGRRWSRQDKGLPTCQAWFTVKPQAMAVDAQDPVGLYFGTTSGEIWGSRNEGDSWTCLVNHLPHICSIEAAQPL